MSEPELQALDLPGRTCVGPSLWPSSLKTSASPAGLCAGLSASTGHGGRWQAWPVTPNPAFQVTEQPLCSASERGSQVPDLRIAPS